MKNMVRNLPPWIYLIFIGLITFLTYKIVIVHDMGQYLSSALNIYNGNGYVDMAGKAISFRSSGFPLMIAASFWLLGVSPWNAFWVIRVFCILNPIIIYLIGNKLFNKSIGFAAALLILTSYTINKWAYKHLDVVWPFFIFLMILWVIFGFEKKKKYFFILSAISLGCGYLVKEIAILFFPFPLLFFLFIKDYRMKSNLKFIIYFYLSLLVSIIPWFLYKLVILKHSIFSVFKSFYSKPVALLNWVGTDSIIDAIIKYIIGFYHFFYGQENSLFENFTFAPLFIIGWGYIIWRLFQKDKNALIMGCIGICFLPGIIFMGISNFRTGQGLYFYYISYIPVALIIYKFIEYILNATKTKFTMAINIKNVHVFVILLVIALFIQYKYSFNNDEGNRNFFKYSVFKKPDKPKIVKKTFTKNHEIIGKWMTQNLKHGKRIIVPRKADGFGFFFYSEGLFPTYNMPLNIVSTKNLEKHNINKNDNIIFITTALKHIDPRNKYYYLKEINLLENLKKNKIDYVIVNKYRNYLKLYFNKNINSFTKIKEFEHGISIFKVNNYTPLNEFKTLVSTKLTDYLKEIYQKDKDFFTNCISVINLRNNFHFDEKDLFKLTHNESSKEFLIVTYKKEY